jgi:hypothetical protein
VVQEDGRAGGRAQRVPHLGVGAGPLGVAAGGHLRRPPLRHARRRPRRHRRCLPHRHPAVQGHDRRHAHGPEEVEVPNLRRALPLLLLRRRHRRADDGAGDGHLAGVQGQDGDRIPGGAGTGPCQPAHQHSQRRRRGVRISYSVHIMSLIKRAIISISIIFTCVSLTVRGGEGSISHWTSWRWPGSPKMTSSTVASPTSGEAS